MKIRIGIIMKQRLNFILLIPCLAFTNTSFSQTLVTYADAKTSPAVYLDNGKQGDSIGDQWLFDQPLLDEHGNVLGSNSGFCIRTQVGHSSQCQWTLTLKQGTIEVSGREFDQGKSAVSITGGTEKYRGISGELITVKQKDGTFKQTLLYSLTTQLKKRSALSLINGVRKNAHYSCSECHSETGNPVITDKYDKQSPILAGQFSDYLKTQLLHFKSGNRYSKEMENVLRDYSDDEITQIADYFSVQEVLPTKFINVTIDTLKHSQTEDISWAKKGKLLYENGDEKRNISACIDCHGKNGQGNSDKHSPKLTSQHARYIRMTLLAYKKGSRTTDKHLPDGLSHAMTHTTKQLSVEDIKYLAAYLQSLRHSE